MTRPHLLDALRDTVLLCDGGMGSRVQALPLDVELDYHGKENCTDVLNLSRPDVVREIHRSYFAAGADMVETNTFGGSPVTLGEFDLADRAFEINKRGGELAREEAARFLQAYQRTIDWMYGDDPRAIDWFAEGAGATQAQAQKARAEFYPKEALRLGPPSNLELSTQQALELKRIPRPLTEEQVARLIQVPWTPA